MGKAVVRGPQSGSLPRCQDGQAHPAVHAYTYTYMHTHASTNTVTDTHTKTSVGILITCHRFSLVAHHSGHQSSSQAWNLWVLRRGKIPMKLLDEAQPRSVPTNWVQSLSWQKPLLTTTQNHCYLLPRLIWQPLHCSYPWLPIHSTPPAKGIFVKIKGK